MQRHTAGGNARLFLHAQLALAAAAPLCARKAAAAGGHFLDLLPSGQVEGVLLQIRSRSFEHIVVDAVKQFLDRALERVERDKGLFPVVAADDAALAVLEVARADLDAQRHTAHFVLGALPAHGLVGVVQLRAHIDGEQAGLELLGRLGDLGLLVRRDGNDHRLHGRDARGQDKAVVVAVGHDDRADHARGGAPGGLERILELVVAAGEGHVVGTGELIAEVVAGRALQRLAVLHHALDGVGRLGARELLLLGLAARNDGNGEDVFKEVRVALELLLGLGLGLLGGLVDGVALLPPELTAAQERARGLFPADDRAPLVVEHRELAVGLKHVVPMVAEHGLGRGAERQALLQLLAAAHRHPCDLGRKAVDQLALLLQQALGDQNGHRHVLVAGLLELTVHDALDILPDRVAVGTQDREALDAGVLDQLRLAADVGIPLGEIVLHVGDLFNLLVLCHVVFSSFSAAGRPTGTVPCRAAGVLTNIYFTVFRPACQALYTAAERLRPPSEPFSVSVRCAAAVGAR